MSRKGASEGTSSSLWGTSLNGILGPVLTSFASHRPYVHGLANRPGCILSGILRMLVVVASAGAVIAKGGGVRELIRKRPVASYATFIVVWTWIFMAVIIAAVPIDPIEGPQFVHVALVFFVASPSVFGLLFTRIVDGKQGIRALFSRAGRWRVSPIWYATSLLLIPVIVGVGVLIQGLLGADITSIDLLGNLAFAVPISLLAAVMEEFGWRGFMLPRLLRDHGALKAALIVGVVWALWHAPINYLGLSKYGVRAIPILLVLFVVPIVQTVIMTWIHNSTRQSMLMMILTHFSITGGFIVFALPYPDRAAELRGNLVTAGVLTLGAIVVVAFAGAKRLTRTRQLT
jgi:membrane protease YdiL (CAAX protease family)